jgi:hypothetical protein
MSVGMPQSIWLTKFGQIVYDAFGEVPYHVGSSVGSKEWRDVDVRLILDDQHFDEMFGMPDNETNSRLAAFTLAFSTLGSQMTGLPIDFQIQKESVANAKYGRATGCVRSALIEVVPSEIPPRRVDGAVNRSAVRALVKMKEQKRNGVFR